MFTDAELDWYGYGCMIAQPRVKLGHPEIDLMSATADPRTSATPPWIPVEEEE